MIGDMLRAGIGARRLSTAAFEQVLGVDAKELSKEWHEAVFAAYRPIAEATKMPGGVRPAGDHEAAQRRRR